DFVVCVRHTFFFQAEDGIRDRNVTGVQTCALPISNNTVDVQELEYDLSAFDFEAQAVNVYQTSAEKDLEKSELKIYSNGFGFEVEENSITTIIIDDVKKK